MGSRKWCCSTSKLLLHHDTRLPFTAFEANEVTRLKLEIRRGAPATKAPQVPMYLRCGKNPSAFEWASNERDLEKLVLSLSSFRNVADGWGNLDCSANR